MIAFLHAEPDWHDPWGEPTPPPLWQLLIFVGFFTAVLLITLQFLP